VDYDVSALSLSQPPALASITTYRPAILVRNNGRFAAIATGTVSAYLAGLRVFHSGVYSGLIPPGTTGQALADTYWTPETKGDYTWIGYVSSDKDQVEPNNNMPASKVTVGDTPPPPAPDVQAHAAQHEEGGQDEVIVDGLHGMLADAQIPLTHKSSHQMGGSDQLDVTGLAGVLSTPQPIADHHEAHENHGGDELNVEGLGGVLLNLQKPQVHANEAHDPNFAASPHGNSAHDPNFCPLDETDMVDPDYLGTGATATGSVLHSDQTWQIPKTRLYGSMEFGFQVPEGLSATVLDFHEARQPNGTVYDFDIVAHLYSSTLANTLILSVKAGSSIGDLADVAVASIPIAAGTTDRYAIMHFCAQMLSGNLLVSATETDNLDIVERSKIPTLTGKALAQESIYIRLTAGLSLPLSTTNTRIELCALSRRNP